MKWILETEKSKASGQSCLPSHYQFTIDISVKRYVLNFFTLMSIEFKTGNGLSLNMPIRLLGIVKYLLLIIQANIYMPPRLSWSQACQLSLNIAIHTLLILPHFLLRFLTKQMEKMLVKTNSVQFMRFCHRNCASRSSFDLLLQFEFQPRSLLISRNPEFQSEKQTTLEIFKNSYRNSNQRRRRISFFQVRKF